MPTEWRVAADHRPGMDRGLYIAASGMLAEQIRQDQIANDLANASTPGYKSDRTAQRTFGDLLLASSAGGGSRTSRTRARRATRSFPARPPAPAPARSAPARWRRQAPTPRARWST